MTTLHNLTGLNISFVDLSGYTKLKKFSIAESAYAERCKFCKLMSSTKKGVKRCMDNDNKMMAKAAESEGAVIQRCHAGLVDMVVPIRAEHELLGFIFAGQVLDRPANEATYKDVARKTADLGHGPAELKAAFRQVPVLTKDALKHAAGLITMVAGYIASTEQTLSYFKQVRKVRQNLRLQLFSDLIYGSITDPQAYSEEWMQAFGTPAQPRALACLKLPGFDARTEHFSDAEKMRDVEARRGGLQEALAALGAARAAGEGAEFFCEYVGSGLFCVLAALKPGQALKPGLLEKAARLGRELLAKDWGAAVAAAVGGEGPAEGLYQAFNRAVVELDRQEHPHGRPLVAVDETEDAFPVLLKKLTDAMRFGQRDEVRALMHKCLHASLSLAETDRIRRSMLLQAFQTLAEALPSTHEARFTLSSLVYDAAEMIVRAAAADQDLIARLLKKNEAVVQLLPEGNRDRHKDLVKRVKAWLDANLQADSSLKQLAKDFGAGQYNLSRVFRKEAGTTIKNYLARRRVEEAAKLLTLSSLSIPEIAEKVGFHDFHYFCLVFKKLVGTPPGTYRRMEQQKSRGEAEKAVS